MTRTHPGVFVAVALASTVTAAGTTAHAQLSEPGNHRTQVELELHLDANGSFYEYGSGYGVGARVNFPIGRNLFLPRVNNSLALGVGADIVYNSQVLYRTASVQVPVVIQWNLYVAPAWSIFFEPGVFTSLIFDTTYCAGVQCNPFYVFPEFAVGARWHFVSSQGFPAFVARIGWPSGLSLGISF